ncbi:39S ribosomal protein L37 mitochondrial [Biomphalaria pfeifferi]|uniref:39S ribosomal protein L37 mitochondrial n=1 Tax=Biomphalaria pfeifferi TaxID=112525 RepID=A0AAD8FLC3_BIOPF|nr:39S ribosomal protein L37 mitochondrial [Biomphalaria pfeifferi]
MRLTCTLLAGLRDCTVRNWKKVWKCRGKYFDQPYTIPEALASKGIPVIKVNDIKPIYTKWVPPVSDDPRFAEPIPPEKQEDWKPEPVYVHHDNVRLFEGIKQVCLIAKAQPFEGFPPSVDKLIGALDVPDRDMILQRYIMQSQVWNTDEDNLPKPPPHPDKPRWKWVKQVGITHVKSTQILVRNLLRLCQIQTAQFPSFTSRKYILDVPIYSHIMYTGKAIIMKEPLDILLTSDQDLPPFADENAVDASVLYKIPDMWPIFPTVDFLKTNNYEILSNTGFSSDMKLTCPHTIIQFPRKTHWEVKHYQAAQIMSCLMYTAALARKRFGEHVKILPKPICVQHVSVEQGKFLFAFFQLNTLDFESDSGIKNFIWTADRSDLYSETHPQPWLKDPLLEKSKIVDYDPVAFDRFLAVYLNGFPEMSSILQKQTDKATASL